MPTSPDDATTVNSILFVYDEAGYLLGEYDGTGAVIQETVWLGDLPVGVLKPGALYNVNPDHLGAPLTVTDVTGQIVWRWDRDPYGNGKPNENPSGLGTFTYNLRFPGQYYDKETELHYNYFRDYNPKTGRYVQTDPIGLAGGENVYAYVGGNPLRYTDPNGLNPVAGAEAGFWGGTFVCGPVCGVVGGVVGAVGGAWLGWNVVEPMLSESKTPNKGEPGSCHVNPGSGQERQYGSDGKPDYDIDWDHDHGPGVPHAHNWGRGPNGEPIRGPGVPVSSWPRGRGPGG